MFKLLYPKAIATSSAISHSCKISLLVGGTKTFTVSSPATELGNIILFNKPTTSSAGNFKSKIFRMYFKEACTSREDISGRDLWTISPLSETTDISSMVNGFAQYPENIAHILFNTILAFVKSVAVTSINTFFVFLLILEYSPLMIGGNERTLFLLSKITGYTGESRIRGKYLLSCKSFSNSFINSFPSISLLRFKGTNLISEGANAL
mmetsp:Transcript_14882/g.23448  ORF Transcript_14882/g.23448 Transcript_14882/m.23448 type:complete len:208 (-) Transcript_14882:534-1157(-)